MDPASPPSPPHEANDIFSLSDSVLSSKLRFIEEVGVYRCPYVVNDS